MRKKSYIRRKVEVREKHEGREGERERERERERDRETEREREREKKNNERKNDGWLKVSWEEKVRLTLIKKNMNTFTLWEKYNMKNKTWRKKIITKRILKKWKNSLWREWIAFYN